MTSDKEASEDALSGKTGDDDEEEDSANEQSSRTESEPEDDAATEQVLNNDDKILPASDDVKHDHDHDDDDEYNDSDGIPWHHMQLYRLYGDEADYFLHPMPVKTEKHVSIKPSKLLKKLCGECSPDTIGRKSMFTFS